MLHAFPQQPQRRFFGKTAYTVAYCMLILFLVMATFCAGQDPDISAGAARYMMMLLPALANQAVFQCLSR